MTGAEYDAGCSLPELFRTGVSSSLTARNGRAVVSQSDAGSGVRLKITGPHCQPDRHLRSAIKRRVLGRLPLMRPNTLRHLVATAVLVALTFALAACGSDDDPTPLPAPTSTTPSSSPSPTTPAWESKYTPEQIQAYNEALARWESYEQRAEPIWAKGKVTPAAKALFKEYWVSWAVPLNRLTFYEQVGDKVVGVPKVLWSRASKVANFSGGGISVTIQQCIDPSTIEVKHAPGAQVQEQKQGPYIRRISLTKAGATSYRVNGLFDVTSGKKVKPCGT
jgi:hypothetical protein